MDCPFNGETATITATTCNKPANIIMLEEEILIQSTCHIMIIYVWGVKGNTESFSRIANLI
jgi:hypothetical protein